MLYQNTGVESFLQEVFKPVQTIDEFVLQLHKAISCVQEDVPVARIEGVLNCVDISLSERAKEATIVLFDAGRQVHRRSMNIRMRAAAPPKFASTEKKDKDGHRNRKKFLNS